MLFLIHRLKVWASQLFAQPIPLIDITVGSLMMVFVLMIGLSLLWGYCLGRDQAHSASLMGDVAIIDLNKVLRAEAVVASHVMQGQINPHSQDQKNWLTLLQQSNASLRSAIRDVAGQGRVVLVGPAVLQGGADITDAVLVKMGLPTKIPDVLPKAVDLFPSGVSEKKAEVNNTSSISEQKSKKAVKPGDSSWLQP